MNQKERNLFTRDCGTKIDLLNLQWIYRAKKYYHLLPPDIYSMTIPIHYRLNVDDFKRLVEAPTVEEFRIRWKKLIMGNDIGIWKFPRWRGCTKRFWKVCTGQTEDAILTQ